MAPSRKDAWLRDELILALNLYKQVGQKPSLAQLDDLSGVLRSMPIEPELAAEPSFRGRDSVNLKLANFVALDPDTGTKGMTRGGAGDRLVWEEFAQDPRQLQRVAAAIRANIGKLPAREAEREEDDLAEAPEGRVLTRAHRVRERNRKLVDKKKAAALATDGKLACVACGFDFATAYGVHGEGFIECHHTVPLSELKPGARTRLADLELVCSNCHRMIHRRKRWLTLDQLRAVLSEPHATHAPRGSQTPLATA
jgi:5-methylcytosine-specific restriction protein A